MADVFVRIEAVTEIQEHPNADRLDVAIINGWQTCVGKGDLQVGDRVLYIPPDVLVPEETANLFGISSYLGKGGRVRRIKLRGENSLGIAIPVHALGLEEVPALFTNLADNFGITKYEPPKRGGGSGGFGGQAASEIKAFKRYITIQNLRYNTDVIPEGTTVFVQEKIHGTNSRIGIVGGMKMSGSHNLRRGNPDATFGEILKEAWLTYKDNDKRTVKKALIMLLKRLRRIGEVSDGGIYHMPWKVPGLENMINELHRRTGCDVIVYGEIYGAGVQGEMKYGSPAEKKYVVFDISINGRFAPPKCLVKFCQAHLVPLAPIVALSVPYTFEAIKELSSGKSLIAGAEHIREGVVIRTGCGESKWAFGKNVEPQERHIFKMVSDEYLTGNYEDFLDE